MANLETWWYLFKEIILITFAAVIDLLLGVLPIRKISRKHDRDAQILPWNRHM